MVEKLKRPKQTIASVTRINTGCGHLYVTLGIDGEKDLPLEVFTTLGKAGSCAKAQLEAITRCISLGLKYGVPIEEYIDELREIKCPSQIIDEGRTICSCADAISKVLKAEMEERKGN